MNFQLPDHLVETALERAIDSAIHIDDKDQRNVAIRAAAVREGGKEALALVAKWLAFASPEMHEAFLREFS